jgi:SAM-dependent methyltransferase
MTPKKLEPVETHLACPLCASHLLGQIEQLTGEQIRSLWKVLGFQFSELSLSRIPTDFFVILHKCRQCGFEFFDPSLAGGETFYKEVDREGYYCPTRPEFARTINFATKNNLKRILDVGCGSGAFLDLAKQAGREAYGIELNKTAAQKARAKGHDVFEDLLHDLDLTKTGGAFDLITLFQVLEHVPNPAQIMKEAAALLNPGGYIAIAVPSAEGIYRLIPYDPHQWPPHHVSRWRIADVRRLAETANMKLTESGGDVLLGAQIEQVLDLHNRFAPVVGCPKRPFGKLLPKMISFVYRKTGLKYIFPKWGSSIYGYFQKL